MHSEIECPELITGSSEACDLTVRFGSLRHIPVDERNPWRSFCIGEKHMLIGVEDAGRFSVREGREVIVDPAPGAEPETLRLFLFGSVFGCVIHQRSLLPLHASAFLHEEEAVLVLAHSGTGKSTLAAAMKKRGRNILADDVCAVKTAHGENPVAYPGVPQIKLHRDSAERLGEDIGSMRKLNDEKYALPALEHWSGHALPIKSLYILNAYDGSELKIVDPDPLEKIEALRNYTYRKGMVAKLGIGNEHLKSCETLMKSARMRRIYRPRKSFMVEELADLIEADLP